MHSEMSPIVALIICKLMLGRQGFLKGVFRECTFQMDVHFKIKKKIKYSRL